MLLSFFFMFSEVATIYRSNFVFYWSIRNWYRDMSQNWNRLFVLRKYTFRYFSFQIRYRYQQVCFTRGKRKAVIFYKYLWHYDLPRFRLKSNNDEAEFARNFNGVNIKCCIQTKTFSYRFTKTCLSLSAVSNVQQEYLRYYNVMC